MIRQAKTIILMGLLSWLFGCKDNSGNAQTKTTSDDTKLEDITSRINPEEGFADIFLKIVSDTKTDTTHIYIAKGLYKNKTVGLQFEVKSNISAGIVDGKPGGQEAITGKAVRLKSIGQESDAFVKAIAELYQHPTTNGFSKQVISATAFSLNSKTADLNKKDTYKFKLFFAEDDENLYSELFFNINTDKKEIELPEKDEGYREPLIKVWTK